LGLVAAWELSAGRKPLVSAETSLVLLSGEHPNGARTSPQRKDHWKADRNCLAKGDLLEMEDRDRSLF